MRRKQPLPNSRFDCCPSRFCSRRSTQNSLTSCLPATRTFHVLLSNIAAVADAQAHSERLVFRVGTQTLFSNSQYRTAGALTGKISCYRAPIFCAGLCSFPGLRGRSGEFRV